MQEIKAFVGQEPEKFNQKRKVPKLPLIIVALLVGVIGTYALIHSLAASTTPFTKIYGVDNAVGWGGIASAHQQLGVNGDRTCQDETNLDTTLTQEAAQGMYFTVCVNSDEGLTSLNGHSQDYANLVATEAGKYGPGGTYWASHSQYSQYAIQSFEIMNEPYGWWFRDGDNDPAAYAHIAAAAIRAGHAANPQAKFYISLAPEDIKLANGNWVDWNQALLKAEPDLFNLADGFSIHIYDTPTNFATTLDKYKTWAWNQTGGNGKPFIITEANLTDQQASPEADYVSAMPQFVQIAQSRDWVKELFIFAWHGYTGRDYLGFLDTNGNPRTDRINAYHTAVQQALASSQPPPSPPSDTTKPSVSVTAPASGAAVSGQAALSASASDNVGVSKVEFYADGKLISTDTGSPYTATWDATGAVAGPHTITAKAYDAAGNVGTSSGVTVTVQPPPSGPASDLLFNGTEINDYLNQSAPGAVTKVPDPLGSGQQVFKFVVKNTDVAPITPTENPRGQLVGPGTINKGDDVWLENKFLLPSDFPSSVPGWVALFATYGSPFDGAGSWTIGVDGNYIQWQRNDTYNYDIPWSMPIVKNQWVTILVHEKYDTSGFIEMWVNGQPITFFSSSYPDYYNPNKVSPITHLSMNTADHSDGEGPESGRVMEYRQVGMFDTVTTYHGPLIMGKTQAAVEAAAAADNGPGGGTTSPPPPDTAAPAVSFAGPANNATVSGIVTATANASDNVGVSKVELSLDGSLKMTDTAAPYNYSFDSKTLSNGNHTLTAKAYDAAGNSSSSTITVKVNNPDTTPPNAPTNAKAAAADATTVNLSWTASADTGANPTGVVRYNVLRNGIVIAQPTSAAYTDTAAVASTGYSYVIQAVDGAGNVSANSNTATVTTPAAPDTTPPSVPAGPAAAAVSSSQINVTWKASTDTGGSGLAGYNVYRNGAKVNSGLITATSYGDSTVSPSTTYSYKVEAVDGAGNKSAQTGSVSASTQAAPDSVGPTVSLTAPADNATVSGSSVTVSASASDNVGVAGVQFKLDGNNLGGEDTAGPYGTAWNTTGASNGPHTLTAVARDVAGNTTTSAGIKVTVNNVSAAVGCTYVLTSGGNLQTFLNNLKPGDVGCVRTGTYGARGTITDFASKGTAGSPIVLKSYPGDARSTILGQFRVTGAYQTVSGFIFNGPTGQVTTHPEDVVVWLYGADNATFSDNEVRNGLYHAGIFVSLVTNAKVLRNYVHDNGNFNDPSEANLDHGIYWANGSGVIANNIITHNYAYGIHLYPSPDNVVVENNTITNHTGRGGIIVSNGAANIVIANNILSGNLDGIRVSTLTGTNDVADTNLFWNNSEGNVVGGSGLTVTNSIIANPLFAGADDYRLTAGSPAIGSANNNYAASPDYAGISRPQGSSDIGAYQFSVTPTPPPVPDTTAPAVSFASPAKNATVSGIVTATADASDNVGVAKVELSLDGALKLTDTSTPYNYSFDSKTLSNGSHTLAAKAYDAAGNSSASAITINVSNPDTTPPNAPANLSAIATDATTVSLKWAASADTGANPTGVVKYNVLRDGVVIAQPTVASYTDATAAAGASYGYVVQAVDAAGNVSGNSNPVAVTTPAAPDTAPPAMPSNLAAAAADADQVNVTWAASTDTGGSGLAGYNVYRNGTKLNDTPVTGTSYGDSTVDPSTTYSYKVEAVDGAGNKSVQTAPVSVTTPSAPDTALPGVPTGLTAKAVSSSRVNLTWKAPADTGGSGLAGYNVYRNGYRLNKTLVTDTFYYDSKVSAGTKYGYKVEAVDGAGNTSSKTGTATVTVPHASRTSHTHRSGGSGSGGSNRSSSSGPSRPGAVSITIVDHKSKPVAGATVTVGGQTSKTDKGGVAHFAGVASGSQTVAVSYKGRKTSKAINIKGAATQKSPEFFRVSVLSSGRNPALLLIPIFIFLAAGGFFVRPWEKFARSSAVDTVDQIVTSNHPPEAPPTPPGHQTETPGAVYSPRGSDDSSPPKDADKR